MTLKSFLSAKNAFFRPGSVFFVPVSLSLTFFLYDYTVSKLIGRAIFGSTALNLNLSLNSGIKPWLGQIHWCRSMLSIGVGYFAMFSLFSTLRRMKQDRLKVLAHFLFLDALYFFAMFSPFLTLREMKQARLKVMAHFLFLDTLYFLPKLPVYRLVY